MNIDDFIAALRGWYRKIQEIFINKPEDFSFFKRIYFVSFFQETYKISINENLNIHGVGEFSHLPIKKQIYQKQEILDQLKFLI